MNILYISISLLGAVLLVVAARWLYLRSVRIREGIQMGRMFTNLSHELLTPLTVISASVERLREMNPEQRKDYALIQLNIERMVRLLQQLLETSKSQAGELRLLVSQGDVMQYISKTALCLQPLMAKRGLEFTIHCMPQTMMGWIDADKVDKIIYNLLSNAAKYTNAPGHVMLLVKTNRKFDHVTITVTDNGIGMSDEQQRRLFHRFHDGDYRKQGTRGTGLGLALTRDLVYLHGGTIDCESKEGIGTTFTVTLPITKDAYTSQQVDEQSRLNLTEPLDRLEEFSDLLTAGNEVTTEEVPESNRNAYSILLVEDNVELLMLMRQLLSHRYRVTTAANGKEALDYVYHNSVDLIVSDVMMPGIDGNELTRRIKSDPNLSHLPIILLTAHGNEEARQQSMLLGADEFIVKPFRLGDLQLRIDNILENRRRLMQNLSMNSHASSNADGNGSADDATSSSSSTRAMRADEEFMARIAACVKRRMSDSDFDRIQFAAEMNMSESLLYSRLRKLTGKSVSAFIREQRLLEACRLIKENPEMRVSDLTYRVGFRDPKYFATCFRQEYGVQPSEYARRYLDSMPKEDTK